MPVSAPAGGNSTIAVAPRPRMVSVHRSQRTGRVSCAMSFSIASAPEVTGLPSTFDSSVVVGSLGVISAAASA